jgi:hypothetical protein
MQHHIVLETCVSLMSDQSPWAQAVQRPKKILTRLVSISDICRRIDLPYRRDSDGRLSERSRPILERDTRASRCTLGLFSRTTKRSTPATMFGCYSDFSWLCKPIIQVGSSESTPLIAPAYSSNFFRIGDWISMNFRRRQF